MPSRSDRLLAKLFPYRRDDSDDEEEDGRIPTQQSQQHFVGRRPGPRRASTGTLTEEAYIPSWQRISSSSSSNDPKQRPSQLAPEPQTGRRKRGQSQSQAATYGGPFAAANPRLSASDQRLSQEQRRQQEETLGNGMLYFGDGVSPKQAMKTYTAGPKPAVVKAGGAGRGKTTGSGRDASGYLRTGVGSSNIMSATYSSLTYGGSTQYNFAGTQSYGAGT